VSLKYKLTAIALVIVAAAAVLIITNQDMLSSGAVETEQIAVSETGDDLEEVSGVDEEFKPATDPYQAYLDAREAGSPIVLEFYARW